MDTKKAELTLETIEHVADMIWLLNEIDTIEIKDKPEVKESKEEPTVPDEKLDKVITKSKKKSKNKPLVVKEEVSSVYENEVSSTKTDIKADPIRMPKKLALSNYRAWEKSFKSFYYKVDSTTDFVLDEAKTVDIIAKTKLVQPIFKAKKVKYFHLTMVIEQSPSMDIWNELILEFQKTIRRFGVFQSIDFYYLSSSKNAVHLYTDRDLKRELDPKKLNLNTQTLLTVVSDCVSSAWHSNHIFKMLEFWSKSVPVSITQMFPKRMWHGTSLYKGFQTSFTSHNFKQLNKNLLSDDGYYDEEDITFNIPVINFEPQSVKAWSSVIHGKRGKWIDGVILEELEELPFTEMSNSKKDVSVEKRVNRYLSQASPLAQELARYASVLPISFHVIRVLQELKLPESSQVHLAEFFLGGLIKREINEQKQVSFDFHEGVRDYFRNQLTATTAYKLQESISNFVSQNLNSSLDFQALIDNPNSTSGLYLSKDEVAFVKLRADTLRKLGGDYGREADRIMKSVVKGISLHIGVDKFSKEHYGDLPEITTNVQDALDMKSILDSEGYSTSILLNEEATIEAVKEALITASQKLFSGDMLILSYSGRKAFVADEYNANGKVTTWVLYNQMMLENEVASLLTLFKENVRILILSDSPLSISTTVAIKEDIDSSQDFYQNVQQSNASASLNYKNIIANVKLISSCSLDEEAYSIRFSPNSIFVTEIKKIWNDGKFEGTIEHFFETLKENMITIAFENKIYQTPIMSTFGIENEVFNKQQPFSIEGIEANINYYEVEMSSIVLIESKINKKFGTGFVIHRDYLGSYILTSAHLIRNIKKPVINDYEVEIKFTSSSEIIDLAVLYVKGLFKTPIELQDEDFLNTDVQMIGYSLSEDNDYIQRVRESKIVGNKMTITNNKGENYKVWYIAKNKHDERQKGSMGHALISVETGKVIGLVNTSVRGGSEAYATSIEYLKNILEDTSSLPFGALKAFNLRSKSLLIDNVKMHQSVVVINSENEKNKAFGTGFVIDTDNEGSYIITSTSVVEAVNIATIWGLKAEVVALGSGKEVDLAVLYIPKVVEYVFELNSLDNLDLDIRYLGYSAFSDNTFALQIQEAIFIEENLDTYHIQSKEGFFIQEGLVGAPLISSDGKVIAVINSTKGNKEAYAIPIHNLLKIWKDIPKHLLSKESNMTEEIEVVEGSTTLLIYMAADNDLDNFAEKDLETIIEASEESDMNIVVQCDRNEFVDVPNTIRLSIKNGKILDEVDLGKTNTGDPTVLKTFIEESVEAYPSDKLIVIVWSHGSGVDDADIYDTERIREHYFVPEIEIEEIAVGFDDSAQDFLDNLELQKALDVSVNIDVLGFDACLMGMFEILYQLKEQTSVMVASQHLEPASGWDYKRILNELDTSATASKMGKQFIDFHDEYHTNERRDVTQSALHTEIIDEVTKELDMFAKVLREELKKGNQKQSRKDLEYTLRNSQFFNRKDYVDLVDLVRKTKNRLGFEALEIHANKLLESLERLVLANHTIGVYMEDANGVSIYFPNESRPFKDTFDMYEKLDFAEACPNWLKLIKWYWL